MCDVCSCYLVGYRDKSNGYVSCDFVYEDTYNEHSGFTACNIDIRNELFNDIVLNCPSGESDYVLYDLTGSYVVRNHYNKERKSFYRTLKSC